MLSDELEEYCSLYAAGALTEQERLRFDVVLEFHPEARTLVSELEALSAYSLFPVAPVQVAPSPRLKGRILDAISGRRQETRENGFVMCDPKGAVQWVNPAFSKMCGYELGELVGKKLGPILQGPLTDQTTVARLRSAIGKKEAVTENLVNYHKNGTPYWVSITITPLFDAEGEVKWFVAREREMHEYPLAA